MRLLSKVVFVSIILTLMASCSDSDPEVVEKIVEKEVIVRDTIVQQSVAAIKKGVVKTYAEVVYANYEDSYKLAADMKTAIDAFVAAPSAEMMQAAKQAWLSAREPYGQTEAFRFASGPIDADDGPEGLLNAWPLDESYIDYVDGGLTSGIINNTIDYPELSKSLLESLNEVGGEENISIGYHAIEYLLWGQDLTAPSALRKGERTFTDFTTADNADRRGQYLKICAELVLDHLQLMLDAWSPTASDNYRAQFLSQDVDQSITQMLTGIATLSKAELAGERMFVAYDNRDQEDEHSCFSDNTHRDTRLNAIGIRNVYTGCYIKVDGISKVAGPSIVDLLNVVNETLADEVDESMNSALSAVESTAIPFDFAISDDSARPAVLDAVNKLRAFGDKLVEVGSALGLSINNEG